LGALLRALIKSNSKAWDLILPHADFAYNMAPSKTIDLSLFKIVYGVELLSPLDLIPRPFDEKLSVAPTKRVEEIKHLHEQVKLKIEKSNAYYQAQANKHKRTVVFQLRDLVWIHLRKEPFPSKRKSKLMPREDGPFELLERVNDIAYKVNFPRDYGVLATLNVADLSPYLEDDHLANLRANSPQQGEDDGGPSMKPHQEPQGTLGESSSSFKFKEKVQALLNQLIILPGLRDMHKPYFVYLLEGNPKGVFSACPTLI